MKLPRKKLIRGDLVLITWLDITSDGTGDPKDCAAVECATAGYYYDLRKRADGTRELITTLTRHDWKGKEGYKYEGGDAYPVGVVLKVERLGVRNA